ncbi:histidyl-tRNA synthetase [Nematocida sp. ERTm5]|nr:histidyl-tRNA synthetase [Nematocida sp. ERTm5]
MDQLIKTAKGTRDYFGQDKMVLDRIIQEVENIYRKRGGVPFDTPTFEIKSILMNKYGEDSKLIYDLADQGGEMCALRYDLTVPLARYLAMTKTVKMKRYHTAKVFRRDQPALAKGRYREFYQSDFDIIGEYAHMAADSEIVSTACTILDNFSKDVLGGNNTVYIRLNHKKLVDSLMEVCGIEKSLCGPIGSAIDKLDKMSWEEVSEEMIGKGASVESIAKIKEAICIKGSFKVLSAIKENEIGQTQMGKEAIKDLERLQELLAVYGVDDKIVLDVSLIRGLDYYTGILLEGGYVGLEGTLVAGGRYDGLVNNILSMNSEDPALAQDLNTKLKVKNKKKPTNKNKNTEEIRCVGISLGVSRLFSVVSANDKKTPTQVMVCSVGSNLLEERIRMCTYLRNNGINTEYFMGESGNFTRHSEYAESAGVDVLVLIGRKEIEEEKYQIIWGSKNNREKVCVHISDLVTKIEEILKNGSDTPNDKEDSEEEILKAQI